MGNKSSKVVKGNGKDKKKQGDSVGDAQVPNGSLELGIPGNSPLARLLLHWEQVKTQEFQTPGEMVRMCTTVWPEFHIQPRWPKFGSCDFEEIKRVDAEYQKQPPRSSYVDSWMWFILKFCDGVTMAVSREQVREKIGEVEMSKFDPLEFLSRVSRQAQPPPPQQSAQPPPQSPYLRQQSLSGQDDGGDQAAGGNKLELELPPPYNLEAEKGEEQGDRLGRELKNLQIEQSGWDLQDLRGRKHKIGPTAPDKDEEETGPGGSLKLLRPLRQVPMGDGLGYVEVPLTSSDLRIIKGQIPSLTEDPLGFVQGLRDALGPSTYSPTEFLYICRQLAGTTYTNQALTQARSIWRDEVAGRTEAQAQEVFPEETPDGWNFQTPAGRVACETYRRYMLQAFQQIIPTNISMTKAFGQPQGKDESPVEYLERMKKNMRQYTGLDPEAPANVAILKLQFVAGSYPDIRVKLQKFDGLMLKPLEELLNEAQKVVLRRDEEKEKKKTKLMVQTVQQVLSHQNQGPPRRQFPPNWKRGPAKGEWDGRKDLRHTERSREDWKSQQQGLNRGMDPRGPLPRDVCAFCKQKGHWKRECALRKGKEAEELVRQAACFEDVD